MSVLVYGGAFDPLHNGHVDIIHYLLTLKEYDRLCLMPTGSPVYKSKMMFSSNVRLAMLSNMFDDDPKIDICTYEIDRSQPSYTVDTMAHLMKSYHVDTLTFVVGFDQLYQFYRWRQFDQILSQCDVLAIPRDGIDDDLLMHAFPEELMPYLHRFSYHNVLPTNISSSRIRVMLQKNASLVGVVPDKVISIIQGHGVE